MIYDNEDRYTNNSTNSPNSSNSLQTHVHEFEGSVKIAEAEEDPHNHRFAGETGEAIYSGGNHYHKLNKKTDFYENHYHRVIDRTGLGVSVGNGKHVHFVEGATTFEDEHRHRYEFATLIEDPIGD